jgi:hypothetical protein
MASVWEDLEAFAAELFDGFFRAGQRQWGQAYVRGLLLEGRRKSVEPMAARFGEDGNRQALAHFITSSPWNAAHVRVRLAWRMHEVIGPEALIVDDTGFLKDGDASACVARQCTGTAGKVTKCQVGCRCIWPPPCLGRDRLAAVPARLLGPGLSAGGCGQGCPPYSLRRSRPGGACGEVAAGPGHDRRDLSWGVDAPLIVADAGYGDTAAFRHGLEERGLPYAVGISGRHIAHSADARPVQPAYAGTGRPPKMQYLEPVQTVKDLVIAAGKAAARPVSWREGSRPGEGISGFKRMYSRFVALRVRPAGRGVRKTADGPELPERWLLAEWPTAAWLRVGHTLTVTETGLQFLLGARRRQEMCRPPDFLPEVHHPIGSDEAVIPDALLHHRRGPIASDREGEGVILRAFLEIDRATMGPERLAAKLGAYARLHSYMPTPPTRHPTPGSCPVSTKC